jgi:Cytochrome b5-like Heme/Steroid binding domain/F-box-like
MTFLDEDDIANNANLLYFTLLALSAITVFRRELSPNHRFAEEHVLSAAASRSSATSSKKRAKKGSDIDWKEIESVLEGTGVLGAPLALVLVWMRLHALKSSRKGGKRRGLPKRGDDNDDGGGGEEFASSDGSQQEMDESEFPMHVEPGENLWKVLPNDVQVQVLSFLHPRDVMSFATVSRSCRAIKESSTLWKRLWLRDYGWVMTSWEPGMQALERSGVSLLEFDDYSARFYFCFAQCYLPYVLASHNTTASCLVGLGGHIYDLTSFLPAHPGSQETVLVNAGRCATEFFAGIRHSFTAQKLAQKLCVLVDMGKMHGKHHYASGLRPTMHTKLVESQYFSCANQIKALAPISTDFSSPPTSSSANGAAAAPVPPPPSSSAGTTSLGEESLASLNSMAQLRAELRRQEVAAKEAAMQRYSQFTPLHECHVYLDPFTGRWVAWYTDFNFRNTFENL